MAGIFGAPSLPPPQTMAAPTVTNAAVQGAAQQQALLAAQAKGQASTVLTGGQGVMNPVAVARKTLLGQ